MEAPRQPARYYRTVRSSSTHYQVPVEPRPAGFTLIELLMVLMLVTCLSLLLVPSLANTKPNSKASQCLNNLRQFTAGWSMYTADNRDRVANNYGNVLVAVQSGTLDNWANNVMTWSAGVSLSDRSNTNRDWVIQGVLGKYFADPVRVYKCPADIFLSLSQVAAGYEARLRSISMNSFFGRYSNGNDSTAQGLNEFMPQYRQYLIKTSVLKPSKTWLVLDEHPDSINDGFFIENPTAAYWADIPASYHNGSCGIAFVDGHSELKRWQSRVSIYPVRYSYPPTSSFDSLGRLDFAWYLEHTGYVNASTGLPAFNY